MQTFGLIFGLLFFYVFIKLFLEGSSLNFSEFQRGKTLKLKHPLFNMDLPKIEDHIKSGENVFNKIIKQTPLDRLPPKLKKPLVGSLSFFCLGFYCRKSLQETYQKKALYHRKLIEHDSKLVEHAFNQLNACLEVSGKNPDFLSQRGISCDKIVVPNLDRVTSFSSEINHVYQAKLYEQLADKPVLGNINYYSSLLKRGGVKHIDIEDLLKKIMDDGEF